MHTNKEWLNQKRHCSLSWETLEKLWKNVHIFFEHNGNKEGANPKIICGPLRALSSFHTSLPLTSAQTRVCKPAVQRFSILPHLWRTSSVISGSNPAHSDCTAGQRTSLQGHAHTDVYRICLFLIFTINWLNNHWTEIFHFQSCSLVILQKIRSTTEKHSIYCPVSYDKEKQQFLTFDNVFHPLPKQLFIFCLSTAHLTNPSLHLDKI